LLSTAYLASRESVRGLIRVIAVRRVSGLALPHPAFAYTRVFPWRLRFDGRDGRWRDSSRRRRPTRILQTIVDDVRGGIAGFYSSFPGRAPLGNLARGDSPHHFGAPLTFALIGVRSRCSRGWFWRSGRDRVALRPTTSGSASSRLAPK
jgi:hypothetical protein